MTPRDFNAAAEKYVFDYDREVAAFYRDYPARKKTLFFLEAASSSVYRGDEDDLDEVADMLAQNASLGGIVEDVRIIGTGQSVRFKSEGYDCVVLKTPFSGISVHPLGYSASSAVTDVFLFDHEAGHLICSGGMSGGVQMEKECIADAYATLRHLQRFGIHSSAIQNLPAMRAVEMVFGKVCDHFTLPVVGKILADAKTLDVARLSPDETAALAETYAAAHVEKPALVGFMADGFKPLNLTPAALLKGDFAPVRALGHFLLQTSMPEQYNWGRVVLEAVLDGNIGVDGARLPKPQGTVWDDMRRDVAARAGTFKKPPPPASGLIIVPKF